MVYLRFESGSGGGRKREKGEGKKDHKGAVRAIYLLFWIFVIGMGMGIWGMLEEKSGEKWLVFGD